MYFKIEGTPNIAQMLSTHGGIDTRKFCNQLLENSAHITQFITCIEVEKWKKYYLEMHPHQTLNEDVLPDGITDAEIKSAFEKFFKPLAADACSLTIIDPYIFANGTNVALLVDILNTNIKSKQVRFVANSRNSNTSIETDIITQLKNMGFTVNIDNRTDIHDRYWYTRKNGFSCGTSFNGISRKTTMMNLFPDQDLSDIIAKFGI